MLSKLPLLTVALLGRGINSLMGCCLLVRTNIIAGLLSECWCCAFCSIMRISQLGCEFFTIFASLDSLGLYGLNSTGISGGICLIGTSACPAIPLLSNCVVEWEHAACKCCLQIHETISLFYAHTAHLRSASILIGV